MFLLTSNAVNLLLLQSKDVSDVKNSIPFKLDIFLPLQLIFVTLAISASVNTLSLAPDILLVIQFLKFASGKLVALISMPVAEVCINVATTFLLPVMLLMVYFPLDTEEVTLVPLTVSVNSLYPLLGVMVRVAAVPSVTVNDSVVFVTAVPLKVTEPPLPDWMESV